MRNPFTPSPWCPEEDTLDVPVSLAGGHHSTAKVLIHFRPQLIPQLQILMECLSFKCSRVDFQQDTSYMDYLLINPTVCLQSARLWRICLPPLLRKLCSTFSAYGCGWCSPSVYVFILSVILHVHLKCTVVDKTEQYLQPLQEIVERDMTKEHEKERNMKNTRKWNYLSKCYDVFNGFTDHGVYNATSSFVSSSRVDVNNLLHRCHVSCFHSDRNSFTLSLLNICRCTDCNFWLWTAI